MFNNTLFTLWAVFVAIGFGVILVRRKLNGWAACVFVIGVLAATIWVGATLLNRRIDGSRGDGSQIVVTTLISVGAPTIAMSALLLWMAHRNVTPKRQRITVLLLSVPLAFVSLLLFIVVGLETAHF